MQITYQFIDVFINSLRLTGWVTHICFSKLTIIDSDNGLSADRCQAIIWTNAGILLIEPLGTKISETYIEICTFSFKKMHLKRSSGKWQPFRLGLSVLKKSADRVDAFLRVRGYHDDQDDDDICRFIFLNAMPDILYHKGQCKPLIMRNTEFRDFLNCLFPGWKSSEIPTNFGFLSLSRTALIQLMAWCRVGTKPLLEPVMT